GTFAGQLAFSSKEVWVIPFFVLFTLCAMRYLAGRPVPVWVRHVNAHSFGIYLAHPMFFVLADLAVAPLALPVVVYALVLIVVGIVGSVALNKLANTFTLGAMLFGKQLKVA
ncbi:MAG: acyltransferase family protein, partial [Halomonas sp.]